MNVRQRTDERSARRETKAKNTSQTQLEIIMNRDAYVEKMKEHIDNLNENMKVLEAKAEEAQKDVRDKYDAQMLKLHAQSKLAVAKLDEMKAAGADTWETMVAEMEKVRDAFVHSFSYFKSQLK